MPFNLQAALCGAPVQQSNGMFARIIRQEGDELLVELEVLSEEDGIVSVEEIITTVDLDGRYMPKLGFTECDLDMVNA